MVTSTMHDMKVMKTLNIPQKSGALMVELGKDAVFAFSYGGITEDEAIALAEKFDWKAMQAAAQRNSGGSFAFTEAHDWLKRVESSLRANGSRERAPDDRLHEAIHLTAWTEWIASSLSLLAMTAKLVIEPETIMR
jgi:hypothetical protein